MKPSADFFHNQLGLLFERKHNGHGRGGSDVLVWNISLNVSQLTYLHYAAAICWFIFKSCFYAPCEELMHFGK